ncbi:ATP-binding protein [Enterococcus cecorum]|uniref:ATP-binding protein n=1 Tax=Enterococcus cecorum TaxID=44008 RepID=UPI003F8EC63C
MRIEDYFEDFDKSYYYLGVISQVYRTNAIIQVENLTLMNFKRINCEIFSPNTINFYVLIESSNGIYFGEIFQSKVSNEASVHKMLNSGQNEKIFPELGVEILGYMPLDEKFFCLPGTNTVGITDKVYIANEKIITDYVSSVEVRRHSEEKLPSFAKLCINSQQYPIYLQPRTLFDRHLMAIGTTNSGKSTSALSILDNLISSNIKVLIIDPTGEYKEAFNDEEVDKYNLGSDAFLSVSKLSFQHWAILFEINEGTQPAILFEAIKSLRYQKKIGKAGPYEKYGNRVINILGELNELTPEDTDFDLSLLSKQIENEAVIEEKGKYKKDNFKFGINQYLIQKVNYILENTSFTNFFNSNEKDIIKVIEEFIINSKKSLYINTSAIGYSDGIGGMIIDLISNYILNKSDQISRPFVIFIDEVHRYTTSKSINGLSYYSGLTNIAREGRKKGIFLFLTTQNPNDVDKVLLGQVGSLLIHRLTSVDELKVISNYLSEQQLKQVKNLNTGEAIFTSVNLLKDLYLKIDKCDRKHHNNTPSLWGM